MKWEEAQSKVSNRSYAALELRPTGKIGTKEQYDYVVYYCEHTEIDGCQISPFYIAEGKYLHIGNYFGGASFYFYLSDKPEGIYEEAINDETGAIIGYKKFYKEFSYGKYGKIEF